jgi:hypothetical protein
MIKHVWIILLIMLLLKGCIEPFYPGELNTQQSLVIDGMITDREGYHYVRITRSVNYHNPEAMPETGCQVEVINQSGGSIQFYESERGLYEQWIGQDFVKTGEYYKIRIITGSGTYESEYEAMIPCAPVGDVYYKIQDQETDDPEITLQGIQFYTDLFAPEGYARNYRWELDETWEYHAEYLIRYFWTGNGVIDQGHSSDSLFFCWSSEPIREFFSTSMQYISGDSMSVIPLRYVSNETDRLTVKYSLLVKQYSLSDEAYRYWDQLRKLSQETGGLYETQPPQIRGNIRNINNEDEIVLGNFNVSAMTEKRIFVTQKFHFFPYYNYDCTLYMPLGIISNLQTPKYMQPDENGIPQLADLECFDCRESGGTTEKPEYWK